MKTYRTLVRFESLGESTGCVVVPAWNPEEVVVLTRDNIPDMITDRIDFDADDIRFYAEVNIGAECREELIFENWQIPC